MIIITTWFRGVMVNTLDFESRDPSSSLGGAYEFLSRVQMQYAILFYHFCASTRLFVHPMPVLSIHHCIYQMYTF